MDNKRRKKIIVTSVVITVILVIIGLAFAWYSLIIVGEGKDINLKFKEISIEFEDNERIEANSIDTGWEATKSFKVKNNTSEVVYYDLVFKDVLNTYIRQEDFNFSISGTNGGISTSSRSFPPTGDSFEIAQRIKLEVGATHNYVMNINYIDADFDQSIDMKKRLKASVAIKASLPVTKESCFNVVGSKIVKYYNYEENNTSKPACTKAVVIPDKINDVTITEIGEQAFYIRNMTSVHIPNGITTIGNDAFMMNSLESIVIPDSVVSVGENGFKSNLLKYAVVSNNMTVLSKYMFEANELESIKLPETITKIDHSVFYGNNIGSFTSPNALLDIVDSAFYSNKLKSVVIKSNTNIGRYTFGKTAVSNPELSKIYNIAKRSIDWNYAIKASTGTPFVTGTVTTSAGNVEIVS